VRATERSSPLWQPRNLPRPTFQFTRCAFRQGRRQHVLRLHAATVAAELAVRTRGPRALTVAIESLSDLRDHPGMTPTEQVSWAAAYGMALIWRQWLTGDARDLDRGIASQKPQDHPAGKTHPGHDTDEEP
jgi:hypothetical protein